MTFYKYCKRCGKRLKGEENRIRGFGKTCFQRVQAEAQKDLNLLISPSNYPIEIDTKQGEKGKNLQGRGARAKQEESSAKPKLRAKQIIKTSQEPRPDSKGKQEDKAKDKQAKEQSKGQGASENLPKKKIIKPKGQGVQTPHLEKTLSPT